MDSLIIPCFEGEDRYCYEIYAVPLTHLERSVSPHAQLRPKIVVNRFVFGRELCVVGSKVYLFDSNTYRDSAVGYFDLLPFLDADASSNSSVVLEEHMIHHMPPMRHPKQMVKAIPTPGGKILVFSSFIEFNPYDHYIKSSKEVVVDFELYDPDKKTWENIPQIYQDWNMDRSHSFEIRSFSFIDESTFVVHTDKDTLFRLTLGGGGSSSRWEVPKCFLGGGLPFYGKSRTTVVGGQLCLTPFFIWDINNEGKRHKAVCRFPIPVIPIKSILSIFQEESSCCYILETEKHDRAHVLKIHKYQLDLVEYFEQKKGLGEDLFLKGKTSLHSPQLGRHWLSSTTFYLNPRSPLPILDDSVTFLYRAAALDG